MIEGFLERIIEPEHGRFGFSDYVEKYSPGSEPNYNSECVKAIEHRMMYALFRDPSLRVGGVEDIEDVQGPTSTHTVSGNGTNRGRKAAEWRFVVGAVHPWCGCALVRLPDMIDLPVDWRSGEAARDVVGPGGALTRR